MSKDPGFLIAKLNRPYYLETKIKRRWLTCFQIFAFVFLFLVVFQPFGLSTLPEGIVTVALGYGLTTFLIMVLLNILIIPLFPKYFKEEIWNVQKELYWNMLNVLLIGLANSLFSIFIGMAPFTLYAVFIFELYTITTAMLPISIMIFIKESRLKNKFEKKSGELNTLIETHQTEATNETTEVLTITSENGKEVLELTGDDLLFIESSDNYVEVYFQSKKELQRKLLRNSLKALALHLKNYPHLFRCHKSYLVNLKKVTHVSGNAQGYKLHLSDVETLIPVSRQNNEEIRRRLS